MLEVNNVTMRKRLLGKTDSMESMECRLRIDTVGSGYTAEIHVNRVKKWLPVAASAGKIAGKAGLYFLGGILRRRPSPGSTAVAARSVQEEYDNLKGEIDTARSLGSGTMVFLFSRGNVFFEEEDIVAGEYGLKSYTMEIVDADGGSAYYFKTYNSNEYNRWKAFFPRTTG